MAHLSLDEYYLESIRRCERLTEEMVEEVSAIVPSICALQSALWLNEGEQTLQKTPKVPNGARPAGNGLILRRELSNLILSVEALTRTVKDNISESLRRSNSILRDEESVKYKKMDPTTLRTFHEYQKKLIKSILILDGLDQALFNAETRFMLNSGN